MIIKFIVEIIIYLQKLKMRDQNYYQRLKQIRQKYGYMDQNNPQPNFKGSAQWQNTSSPKKTHQKSALSYDSSENHFYQKEKFNTYERPQILANNEHIYNVQPSYGKRDGPHLDYTEKFSQGLYKKEAFSPQKKPMYDFNSTSYGRQQITKSSLYDRPHMTTETHMSAKTNLYDKLHMTTEPSMQAKTNLYDRAHMPTESHMPAQPSYHDTFSRKDNYKYSSPIKRLAGEQSGRSYNTLMQDIRNSPGKNNYSVTPDFHPRPNTYTEKPNLRYERPIQLNHRQSPKKNLDFAKTMKSVSPYKATSSNFTPSHASNQIGETNPKFNNNITNIDKIQQKIQSILHKNK